VPFEKEISPFYEEWEQNHMVPRELWNTLGQAGLLCPDVDEAYGGAGTTAHVTLAMIEELSRMGFGGFASGYGIHSNIIAPYLSRHGTEAQKAHWLPRMVTGEVVGALAMTEPGAGSNVQGIRTNAVRDGDEWVLNGSKIFITNGIHADLVIVAAITDPGKGAKGTSLFLVDAHAPGFEKSKKIEKIGQHTSDTGVVVLHRRTAYRPMPYSARSIRASPFSWTSYLASAWALQHKPSRPPRAHWISLSTM
jgi:acyl-CoA dehydrogenase